jgi:hypothetical protein
MVGDADPAPTGTAEEALTPPPRRLTREELDRIFGSDPVSTRDDLPDPEPTADRDATESWYLANRPPHHGG